MISRRRQLAERLLKEGGNYSPVQHWTQAAARVMGGLSGAIAWTCAGLELLRAKAERTARKRRLC
jgi:hypothetical protein